MVMGPTPPGTGVIMEATSFTPSKSVSPARRKPDFLLASGMRLTPTSITTAPLFTMSAVTVLTRPVQTMSMSACFVKEARSFVPVWQIVTVQLYSRRVKRTASGFPTILLRPTTTAWAPSVFTPIFLSITHIPCGVQGRNPFEPMSMFPTLTGWKPSTSFSGEIASVTFCSFICLGRGSWTRIPCTEGSLLSFSISAKSSSSLVVSGRTMLRSAIPASAKALRFPVT